MLFFFSHNLTGSETLPPFFTERQYSSVGKRFDAGPVRFRMCRERPTRANFPPIALGYLLLLLLGRTGPVGALLADAGLPMIFTPAAVYFAALVAGLPLVVRPVVAALESPALRDLEFAAAVHGAGPLTIFFRVTLPLIRTHILSGLLLGLTRASGEVGITMMLGGNLSGRTNTLSLEIFNAVSRADFDAATALCLVLSAFTLLVFVLLEALRRRSVAL